METYKKVLEGNEDLIERLEKLHKQKAMLKNILEKEKEPFVVEMSGLPRTSKTECLEKIYDFFKHGNINIVKADEPAYIIKSRLTFNEIKNMSSIEFNDMTLTAARSSLKDAKEKNPDIILMDRGIIDNYFWYQMLFNNSEMSKDIYLDRLKRLKEDLSLIDKLFVMNADTDTIIYRDYINNIYLEERNKTTKEKVDKLRRGVNGILFQINDDGSKIKEIDTSNISNIDTSIMLSEEIMDGINKKVLSR